MSVVAMMKVGAQSQCHTDDLLKDDRPTSHSLTWSVKSARMYSYLESSIGATNSSLLVLAASAKMYVHIALLGRDAYS